MKKIIFSLCFLLLNGSLLATHLRAGQISVQQIEGTTRCKITLTIFTNTSSIVFVGGRPDEIDLLDFGDGNSIQIPEQANINRPDLGRNVGVVEYIVEHTYLTNDAFHISYTEFTRNVGILNMVNSVETAFYIETLIKLIPGRTYSTPSFLLEPIFKSQLGISFAEALSATDANGYQLFYYLDTPKQSPDQNVNEYQLPENISMDPISGLLTWDGKFKNTSLVGEFAFNVKVFQIMDDKMIGYISRDFQIILNDDVQNGPSISGGRHASGRIYTPENETAVLRAEAISPANREINLQVVSELLQYPDNFSYTVTDSIVDNDHYKVAKLSVLNNSEIIRDSPYIIVVRVTDSYLQKKDVVFAVSTKDIIYEEPLVLSTSENIEAEFRVFPNPTSDFVVIENKTRGIFKVVVRNSSGKIIETKKSEDSALLDLRGFSGGLYLISVHKGTKSESFKIVKE